MVERQPMRHNVYINGYNYDYNKIKMQQLTTGMFPCLTIDNEYNRIDNPEWVKNASWRSTPSLLIAY